MSFLGHEVKNGQLGLGKYMEQKKEEIGYRSNIHELETVIRIISCSKRVFKGTERILGPPKQDLKKMEKGELTEEWIHSSAYI